MLLRTIERRLSSSNVGAGKDLTKHPALLAPPLASENPKGEVIFQENRWQSQSQDENALSQTTCGSESPSHLPGWQVATWSWKVIVGNWRSTCTGEQFWHFILLTLRWPLIKIPLGIEESQEGDKTPSPARTRRSEPVHRGWENARNIQPEPPGPGVPRAPLVFRDFGPSSVESLFPLQFSRAREERNLNPNHKETSPGSRPIPRPSWSPLLAACYS